MKLFLQFFEKMPRRGAAPTPPARQAAPPPPAPAPAAPAPVAKAAPPPAAAPAPVPAAAPPSQPMMAQPEQPSLMKQVQKHTCLANGGLLDLIFLLLLMNETRLIRLAAQFAFRDDI